MTALGLLVCAGSCAWCCRELSEADMRIMLVGERRKEVEEGRYEAEAGEGGGGGGWGGER